MLQKSLARSIRVAALFILGLATTGQALAQQGNAAPSATADGRNAVAVSLGQKGNRSTEFKKVDGGRWIESDTADNEMYSYFETRRDDSSVYLLDRTRETNVQLDLKAKKAIFSAPSGVGNRRKRDVFDILGAVAGNPEHLDRLTQFNDDSDSRRALGKGGVLAIAREAAPTFCWVDSSARAPGKQPGRVADCPSGYSHNGVACTRKSESIAAPSRAADCPAGYTANGNSCERPAVTKANPLVRPADCPDGYTNTSGACFRLSAATTLDASSMTCKGGETKLDSRCFKPCEAGFTAAGANCIRPAATVAADKMTCKAGFTKDSKTNRCIAECAAGFTNTGEACVRNAEIKGIEAMTCKAGETRSGGRCLPAGGMCAKGEVLQGGLCYSACAPGTEAVGGSCLAATPKSWLRCGIGAGKDQASCTAVTFDTVSLVKQNAVLVALLGNPGAEPPATRVATMTRKYKELVTAYNFAKEAPEFKRGLEAWEKAATPGTTAPLDKLATATSEEDMVRHAIQLAAIVDAAEVGNPGNYPKCSTLFPAK